MSLSIFIDKTIPLSIECPMLNRTHVNQCCTHVFEILLMNPNLFVPTSLTLNIDKITRNLNGPHLHTQIRAYLATSVNLNK